MRSPRRRRAWRTSACTPCGIRQPWPGSKVGVHIKAVADLLGHSSIAITGDMYGHTSDNTARHAVDALADQPVVLDI